jgi:SRSO17 transposase
MDVHASPVELPEWPEFLGAFQVRLRRPAGRQARERYTTGLLTERPNQHGDTLAQAVPGSSEQRLQEVLTNRPWDAEALNQQRVRKMIAEATRGAGVLVFDDTGFPKQGTASVGVERQYSGTLGKVGNGQIAVPCGYTDRQATWPVAVRLSLPKTWAQDHARRQQTRVPAEIPFQTTPEMALTLLDQARAWGVPHRCVVADADAGDNPHVLAGLEVWQESYVVAVRTDFQMCVGPAATRPVWRADQRLQTVPRWPWRMVRWRHGTTG